ncbi:MAG: hypothetical protein JW971_09185 [Synergistales bacterium]|nr:hypothetical protein [Synergistales bacterium]
MSIPMQISLDELLSMLMARVDGLALNQENMRSRFNILGRVFYRKGLIDEEDIFESITEEHRIMKDLGLIDEMPGEDILKAMSDSILQWIKGDVETIRKSMEEYEKKMQELASKQAQKPKIDVASPAVLEQLNRMSGQQKKGGGKIIL